MATRRLLDAQGGIVSVFHYDEATDRTIVSTHQDAEPILERNKQLQTLNDGYTPSRDMKRIASIPMNLAMKWVREAGISQADFWSWPGRDQNEFFRKRYKSNEYQYVRTS